MAGRLRVRDLRVRVEGREVVHGVSLTVTPGNIVGLLGANGAGKTTTFSAILGLIPATDGSVKIDDLDLTWAPVHKRARAGLGFLPQQTTAFDTLSAYDNIAGMCEISGLSRSAAHERTQELLKQFGLEAESKQRVALLSGGQRRRLEVARALATSPDFLLLDEPFAGVDPIAVGGIRGLMHNLARRGIGVLVTDHNVSEMLRTVNYAFVLAEGRVLALGTPTELVANPNVRKYYLGNDFKL